MDGEANFKDYNQFMAFSVIAIRHDILSDGGFVAQDLPAIKIFPEQVSLLNQRSSQNIKSYDIQDYAKPKNLLHILKDPWDQMYAGTFRFYGTGTDLGDVYLHDEQHQKMLFDSLLHLRVLTEINTNALLVMSKLPLESGRVFEAQAFQKAINQKHLPKNLNKNPLHFIKEDYLPALSRLMTDVFDMEELALNQKIEEMKQQIKRDVSSVQGIAFINPFTHQDWEKAAPKVKPPSDDYSDMYL